jgi:hypothetical protein
MRQWSLQALATRGMWMANCKKVHLIIPAELPYTNHQIHVLSQSIVATKLEKFLFLNLCKFICTWVSMYFPHIL